MRKNERGLALPLVVAAIALLLGIGAVVAFRSSNPSPNIEVAQLSSELESAQARLLAEQAKLDDMNARIRSAYPLHSALRSSFSRIKALIQRTDSFFSLSGSDLVLKIKGSAKLVTSINDRRKMINDFLERWRRAAAISFTTSITPEIMSQIIADAQAIGLYSDDIETLIKEIAANNPNIPQEEIADYQSTSSSAHKEVQDIINSLQNANSNQTPPPPPNTPTQAEIDAQAALVAELARQVAELQKKIADILASNPYLPEGYVGTSNPNEPLFYDPIRIKDGSPQLIEGTNQD